ncbi:MAG TPA: hypothetical protein VKY92_16565, partial [Verrucomicrobiae bacterium]|nr:hypothetical protein [Verrucomicrobiae bacterium]
RQSQRRSCWDKNASAQTLAFFSSRKGRMTLAQGFNLGFTLANEISPAGTAGIVGRLWDLGTG